MPSAERPDARETKHTEEVIILARARSLSFFTLSVRVALPLSSIFSLANSGATVALVEVHTRFGIQPHCSHARLYARDDVARLRYLTQCRVAPRRLARTSESVYVHVRRVTPIILFANDQMRR